MRTLILSVFTAFVFSTVNGQGNEKNNFINNLTSANSFYEKGDFLEAIKLLESVLKSDKIQKSKIDAYRLLALCYQQLNDEPNTNMAISYLLKSDHKYQLFPYNDPKDFTALVNSFTVENKLTLGLKTGFNYSLPNISKGYSIKPATIEIQSERGQFLGINGDYLLKGRTFGINFWASSNSLVFTEKVVFNAFEAIKYREDLKQVDLGLELKYFPLKKSRIQPYIGIGSNALIIRNAVSNVVYSNSKFNTKLESSRDMKSEGNLNSVSFNGIADIGISTAAGKGIFGIGIQYVKAFTLSNNPDNRYENVEYTLTNQWVDSDIKINYINTYFTYSFPLSWRVYK